MAPIENGTARVARDETGPLDDQGTSQEEARASPYVTMQTTIDDLFEVRPPTTEVVVDVDYRDLCCARAFFKTGNVARGGQCSLQKSGRNPNAIPNRTWIQSVPPAVAGGCLRS